MRLNHLISYLFYILIVISIVNKIHCKKKGKQQTSGTIVEESRPRSGLIDEGDEEETDEEEWDGEEAGDQRPNKPGRGRGRGPSGGLPPGLAKKQGQRPNNQNQGNNNKKNKKPKNKGNKHNNDNNGNNNGNDNRPRPQTPAETAIEPTEEEINIPASEWRQLERLKHHWANTAHTKSGLSRKFIFFLERDTSYQRHDACLTPDNALGSCHYVQHCPIPDVIRSFDKFLSYVCFIHNRYVGVCCPDDYLDDNRSPQPSQPVLSAPTRRPKQPLNTRPTTRPHTRPQVPSVGKANDGSDYVNDICGVSENTRIIGGALADPKDWLWMAAILLTKETKPYCGGAVITEQHILTAAHCLKDVTPDQIIIRLGAYDFSPSAAPEAQDYGVEYFKIHSQYNRYTNENDLAIIKLSQKTPFTDSVKPICLPQRNRDYAGQLAVVTGWGHTSFGGAGSPQLRQVSLPVWNNTWCDSSYSVDISDQMLCAGNPKGGKDSCQGDSGGPLMLQGPNQRWMIIGVVSWGIKCGEPNQPGVYTRISKYIDWIRANSNDVYK